MAGNENFCLRLKEFNENIKTSWQDLQAENDFCDVTLACEDKQIQAHKIIIASCSSVLKTILKMNKNSHPFIYLRRVKYKDLQNLLNFMYQGEVNIAQEDLSSFLEVAQDLNIRGLSEVNQESSHSKGEEPLLLTTQNSYPSPIRKRNVKNENLEDIINEYSINGPYTEFVQESVNFSDNDSKDKDFISSMKIQNKMVKNIKNGENTSRSLVYISDDGKKFNCGKCDKTFSSQQAIAYHNKSTHEEIRYSCSQCEYKATQKYTLKRHVQSIHEEIRHPCNQCNYKATQKDNLQVHIQSVHKL